VSALSESNRRSKGRPPAFRSPFAVSSHSLRGLDYFTVLRDFIVTNRSRIIELARLRVKERTGSESIEVSDGHGIPRFLSQLVDALIPAPAAATRASADAPDNVDITDAATLHGHDLLKNGFTIGQVVHGYGDVCQVVTELAANADAAISAEDFRVFNRCLDDAIAGAVTAYGDQREVELAYEGTERLGVLAHEMRNLLNTAILSFEVIRKGMVGLSGSTGTIHSRSLSDLRSLIERSLTEVRLEAGVPRLEPILLREFIAQVEAFATVQAEVNRMHLVVAPVDAQIVVYADRQLLSSAVSNLLQNAFKFSRAHASISLVTRVAADRVLIEVTDECGGLPPGKAEEMFRPFVRRSANTSGLGLGLSIARNAVRASSGGIRVRDLPGTGCVFTVDLPRHRPDQ
jgi:signal transduction histidine kinase